MIFKIATVLVLASASFTSYNAQATVTECACICRTPGGWQKIVPRDLPDNMSSCAELNGSSCGDGAGTVSACVQGTVGSGVGQNAKLNNAMQIGVPASTNTQ